MWQETALVTGIICITLSWCCWLLRDAIRWGLLKNKVVQAAVVATDTECTYQENEEAWTELRQLCNQVRVVDPDTLYSLLES